MVLKNRVDVAKVLRRGFGGHAGPLIHLILTGHCHQLDPEVGALPTETVALTQAGLSDAQAQLAVGTLLQDGPDSGSDDWPHQFQVLRFYETPTDRTSPVMLQRIVLGRQHGSGPYAVIPHPSDGSTSGEWMALPVA